MNRYLLWAVDSDGVYHLMARFLNFEDAKRFARMLSVQDDFINYLFCVEEF